MSGSLPVMNCVGCGACCTNMGHPLFWRAESGVASDPHWFGLPQALQDELDCYINSLEDIDMGQPCFWFDAVTRQCKHYEHRPQICRDFEAGNYHCLRMRHEQGIVAQFGD